MAARYQRMIWRFALLICILHLQGCFERDFVTGHADVVSVSDTAISDSSIFVGYVYEHPDYGFKQPVPDAQVWLSDKEVFTSTNSEGYYFLKTVSGKHRLKCQSDDNQWSQLIVEKDIEINKNEKVQIDFYLGYTVE